MNAPIVPGTRPLYRSVFVSDTHLGTRGARCDFLADFLRRTSCQHLFLVGDIFDGWRLRKSWYWDETTTRCCGRSCAMRAAAPRSPTFPATTTRCSAPGCLHPGAWRSPASGCARRPSTSPPTGKRLLVMHGDEFDSVVRYAKFLALLGDWAYTAALIFNRWFNAVRRRLGYPYWSLSAWLKRQVKEAVKAVDRFEIALADEARRRGFDGVVCGHIHHAEMREVQGVLYLNDGDWVESCTALVEHHDGRLELIDWAAVNRLSFFAPRRNRVARSCLTRSPSKRRPAATRCCLPRRRTGS